MSTLGKAENVKKTKNNYVTIYEKEQFSLNIFSWQNNIFQIWKPVYGNVNELCDIYLHIDFYEKSEICELPRNHQKANNAPAKKHLSIHLLVKAIIIPCEKSWYVYSMEFLNNISYLGKNWWVTFLQRLHQTQEMQVNHISQLKQSNTGIRKC